MEDVSDAHDVIDLARRRHRGGTRVGRVTARAPSATVERAARCLGCAQRAPIGAPAEVGRCFGHYRLPETRGSDRCSAWRRRPLSLVG